MPIAPKFGRDLNHGRPVPPKAVYFRSFMRYSEMSALKRGLMTAKRLNLLGIPNGIRTRVATLKVCFSCPQASTTV